MIVFNKPPYTGNEDQHVLTAMRSGKISGDGHYGHLCQKWFEEQLGCKKALLTPSCTHALEMAALLLDLQPGDEVIMPSYTFVSTANAFALRGAKIVFVDIRPDTMNMNETLIEQAITPRTRAIVPVHYAGVACEMDVIMDIADRHGLAVVEDAAQGMMSTYRGKRVGTHGHLSAFSFHETKNYTSGGEGGLLLINDERYVARAEIIREKGTNRSQFFRGMTDKYSWVDVGSSYLPSEIQAAFLWGQLERADQIMADRMQTWQRYDALLRPAAAGGRFELPTIPASTTHNAHMYYAKAANLDERTRLIEHLKANGVSAVFHYVPLHSASAGAKFGRFHGSDTYTTAESERLVRLPVWYGISDADVHKVASTFLEFFN